MHLFHQDQNRALLMDRGRVLVGFWFLSGYSQCYGGYAEHQAHDETNGGKSEANRASGDEAKDGSRPQYC